MLQKISSPWPFSLSESSLHVGDPCPNPLPLTVTLATNWPHTCLRPIVAINKFSPVLKMNGQKHFFMATPLSQEPVGGRYRMAHILCGHVRKLPHNLKGMDKATISRGMD